MNFHHSLLWKQFLWYQWFARKPLLRISLTAGTYKIEVVLSLHLCYHVPAVNPSIGLLIMFAVCKRKNGISQPTTVSYQLNVKHNVIWKGKLLHFYQYTFMTNSILYTKLRIWNKNDFIRQNRPTKWTTYHWSIYIMKKESPSV